MLAAQKILTLHSLRTKPTVVFAALLLAALQFTTATHQFDHTASDAGDVCSFCLQLDKLDDVGAVDSATALLPSINSFPVEVSRSLLLVNRKSFSQPRAPPFS